MTFESFKLGKPILEAISYMGFEKPTEIQELAIPAIMQGQDLIACAQTGTGKTAAFILPIIHELIADHKQETSTLVIVPTRELAIQIHQQIQGFAYFSPVSSTAIYGGGDGSDWASQKSALMHGNDIIVATPGKLISHLNMGYVKFDKIRHLILDEADRMLDMGFREDIEKIIKHLPKKKQSLLFSATMPKQIRDLAATLLHDPMEINLALSKPAEGVLQAAYLVYDNQKNELILELVSDKPAYKSILIFCGTKQKVADVTRALKRKNLEVESISSDLSQDKREEVLLRFKSKSTRILVATDVLSRGIDIKDINLVINYDVPQEAEDYVHRVGRTARADTTGVAITMINPDDMFLFQRIESLIEREVMKLELPGQLGQGPEWKPRGGRSNRMKGKPARRKKPGSNRRNRR